MLKKKRTYNLKSVIRSALRKIWMYSPQRKAVLDRCRVSRGVYQCENKKCGKFVGPKLIEVDHDIKCTPKGGINTPADWGIFIGNLLYRTLDELHGLCKTCHDKKTEKENEDAKAKKKKKTKRKKR